MADSTTHLDVLSSSQSQKEVTANAMFDAASPASLFGRRASTSTALTWGYYGGDMLVDGVLTTIANGTVALTGSTTNYVEATRAGVVSKNTTGFTAGQIPLYEVVTGTATVTSYTDRRCWVQPRHLAQRLAKAMSDANTTLTAAEARCDILEFTGTLTAQRNIVLPLVAQHWTVYNGTTGGYALQFIGATGTGVLVGSRQRATLYCDGTNIVAVYDPQVVNALTGSATVGASDRLVTCDATSAGITATLSTSSPQGHEILITKIDTGANVVTVSAGSGQTIEGASSIDITAYRGVLGLVLAGTTWRVVIAEHVRKVDFYDAAASGSTWTKATWGREFTFIAQGGGGGGGSGRKGAAGSDRAGGGGGAAGRRVQITYSAQDISAVSTSTVTVAATANGGPAITASSTNGSAGTAGNTTSFSGLVQATGGAAGAAGTTAAAATSAAPQSAWDSIGSVGVAAGAGSSLTTSAGVGGATVGYHPSGGGAGGSIDSSNTVRSASASGAAAIGSLLDTIAAGTSGGTTGSGGSGNNMTAYRVTRFGMLYCSSGGGGGAAARSGGAFAGGNGGVGSGGGGGGAGEDGASDSGAGGSGGAGFAAVITHA